jgi:hypothetical protein
MLPASHLLCIVGPMGGMQGASGAFPYQGLLAPEGPLAASTAPEGAGLYRSKQEVKGCQNQHHQHDQKAYGDVCISGVPFEFAFGFKDLFHGGDRYVLALRPCR